MTTPSTLVRRPGRRALAALCLAGSLLAARPDAQAAAPATLPAQTAASAAQDAPWWQGFRDPVLLQLIGPAPTAPQRAAATAQAWIAAQVFHVQAATTHEIGRTARTEQRLVMNAPLDAPQRAARLAQLASRIEAAEAAARERLDRRNEQLERLATLAEMTPEALTTLVQERLQALSLPQFDAEAPPAGSAQDDGVAGEIRRLIDHERRAALALAAAKELQLEYQTLKAADPQEPEAQLEVLQTYERLLLQGQQVAAASGDLAMAWLSLLQAHGGRLSALGR